MPEEEADEELEGIGIRGVKMFASLAMCSLGGVSLPEASSYCGGSQHPSDEYSAGSAASHSQRGTLRSRGFPYHAFVATDDTFSLDGRSQLVETPPSGDCAFNQRQVMEQCRAPVRPTLVARRTSTLLGGACAALAFTLDADNEA